MNRTRWAFSRIPDWPALRRRWTGYWNNEVPDNRILAHVQNPNPERPPPDPWMTRAGETDYLAPHRLYALAEWRQTGWNWHADLFRYKTPSYGPNLFIGFCGAPVRFGPDTVWHEPCLSSLDRSDAVHFDCDNRYWKAHLETVAWFAERCTGRELLGMTDFGGPADWISACMGTERFLVSSLEQPEAMREFALRLVREWREAWQTVTDLIAPRTDGYVNWMPVWSDGPMTTVQDDIAVNFSPELYADVFLPALREMAASAPRAVLHWHDGCRQHIDALLAAPEFSLIHYGHDPNTGPFPSRLPEMKQIQAAGKRLFISCVDAPDAEFFVRNLDPRGLMMIVNTASDDASRRMHERLGEWTARRLSELE